MNLIKYPVVADGHHETYEFLSEGPKGTIKKVVLYQEIDDGLYNLAFGDWDEKNQRIDDRARSNNKDMTMVLATVASTVVDFIKHHPEAMLIGKGSTPGRTRIYQMGIGENWKEISQLFDVEGFSKTGWEPFEPGKNYLAFTLKAK